MANITNIGSIGRYKNSLCNVCFFSALLEKYAEKMERKEKVKASDVAYAATMLKNYKQFLIVDKEMLGFTDGLTFMQDNQFMGFGIENGRFKGDRSRVRNIVEKWVKGFPESANNYQYEVSMLVLALAFPDEIEETLNMARVAA